MHVKTEIAHGLNRLTFMVKAHAEVARGQHLIIR